MASIESVKTVLGEIDKTQNRLNEIQRSANQEQARATELSLGLASQGIAINPDGTVRRMSPEEDVFFQAQQQRQGIDDDRTRQIRHERLLEAIRSDAARDPTKVLNPQTGQIEFAPGTPQKIAIDALGNAISKDPALRSPEEELLVRRTQFGPDVVNQLQQDRLAEEVSRTQAVESQLRFEGLKGIAPNVIGDLTQEQFSALSQSDQNKLVQLAARERADIESEKRGFLVDEARSIADSDEAIQRFNQTFPDESGRFPRGTPKKLIDAIIESKIKSEDDVATASKGDRVDFNRRVTKIGEVFNGAKVLSDLIKRAQAADADSTFGGDDVDFTLAKNQFPDLFEGIESVDANDDFFLKVLRPKLAQLSRELDKEAELLRVSAADNEALNQKIQVLEDKKIIRPRN